MNIKNREIRNRVEYCPEIDRVDELLKEIKRLEEEVAMLKAKVKTYQIEKANQDAGNSELMLGSFEQLGAALRPENK